MFISSQFEWRIISRLFLNIYSRISRKLPELRGSHQLSVIFLISVFTISSTIFFLSSNKISPILLSQKQNPQLRLHEFHIR